MTKFMDFTGWLATEGDHTYGFVQVDGRDGKELKRVSFAELAQMADAAGIEPGDRGITDGLYAAATKLGVLSLYSVERATLDLSKDERLEVLAAWFNGGGGLPAEDKKTRRDMTHPALMDLFLGWVTRYCSLTDMVDGRISCEHEDLINFCRARIGKAPVRRF